MIYSWLKLGWFSTQLCIARWGMSRTRHIYLISAWQEFCSHLAGMKNVWHFKVLEFNLRNLKLSFIIKRILTCLSWKMAKIFKIHRGCSSRWSGWSKIAAISALTAIWIKGKGVEKKHFKSRSLSPVDDATGRPPKWRRERVRLDV